MPRERTQRISDEHIDIVAEYVHKQSHSANQVVASCYNAKQIKRGKCEVFCTAAGMLPFIGFQVGLPISTAFCKAVDGKRLVPISSQLKYDYSFFYSLLLDVSNENKHFVF